MKKRGYFIINKINKFITGGWNNLACLFIIPVAYVDPRP